MGKAMPISRAAGSALVVLFRFFEVLVTFAAVGIVFTRSTYTPVSENLFGPDAPLMNSVWVDVLMRPVLSIPIVSLVLVFLYIRSKSDPGWQRLGLDAAYTVVMVGWLSLLLIGLYSSILFR